MNPRDDSLAARLEASLRRDIAQLGAMPDSAVGRRAGRRMLDVATHAPAFLCLLVEPLLEGDSAARLATLEDCARVHLYARVLDDALDENLPLDRRNLLRIQPQYWRAVYSLGARHPAHAAGAAALVEDTVAAVAIDDAAATPGEWGRKNAHLLLAPLLLSGDSAAWRAAAPGLLALLALDQAGDELAQGRLVTSGPRAELAACLEHWLDPAAIEALRRHGWRQAAARLLHDGAALLRILTTNGLPA
ncbi:hypothetical protein [Telluria beijingensis]|uniref:hypothetical protein n=1 Tax=Telluria beijingensis TaxID=3068633 RepID=UPI002795E3DF|nr:hypothetical protein [Massilia sp. REN29]